jgi:Asp-tRNA(Asn)/Glu-tRNA(Gln) amidotransferase B subunit
MVSDDRVTVVSGRLVMDKIIDGDERMPSVIAEDLGLVGQVSISEDVKATTNRVLANNQDILDRCIKEDDELPLMKIVTQVMSELNPNQRWRNDYRVGDPVCIKDLCTEAMNKRRAEKGGRS